MIRLIATDLDDTILPEGTFDLNPEYYEVIRELNRKGIMFVAASGRHTSSVRFLFDSIKDEMVFLAGNGSCVTRAGKTIDVRPLDYGIYPDLVRMMRDLNPPMIMADRKEVVFTDSSSEELCHWVRDGYKVTLKNTPDILSVEGPILKVAMRVGDDAVKYADMIRERFGSKVHVMAAGYEWVDVVAKGVDKGQSLKQIQKTFGISREETAAFGDNDNDIGMLQCAGSSFAVANARDEVKKAADEVIGPMSEDAVLRVLKGWL